MNGTAVKEEFGTSVFSEIPALNVKKNLHALNWVRDALDGCVLPSSGTPGEGSGWGPNIESRPKPPTLPSPGVPEEGKIIGESELAHGNQTAEYFVGVQRSTAV
jgi:hypothetical protein